jgi:uncharacterized protein YodC (DUF2158 family)
MAEFRLGDVVKHKMGGPLMTVSQIHVDIPEEIASPHYRCRWFDRENRLHEAYFSQRELLLESN